MVRSRLPVPSLLRLFGAVQMQPPELLMEVPISDLFPTRPWLRAPLAFAVEKYNRDRDDIANYFKVLRVLTAQFQMIRLGKFDLTVEFVKTTCRKGPDRKLTYDQIQECEQLPGNQKKTVCNFIIKPGPSLCELNLASVSCT